MWSVFFVFLSYLDRNFVMGDFLSRALDAEKESKEMFSLINGTFCVKMSTVGENLLYQVSDGAEVVRSVVSPAGKLVNCSVIVNQMGVKSFIHECQLGMKEQRAEQHSNARFTRMDEAKLLCQGFKDPSERSGWREKGGRDHSALRDKAAKRTKRGFTYPGTLWCGAGNMADHYDQLGQFVETDSCCRTHDHCPHVIHAFSSKYGHTNFKWHSICHCDCDNALKSCLREVNDTSSRIVGQAFFNVISVPCFEFVYEEQCVERYWYGVCKRHEKLPIAVLKEAVPYDFGGIAVIDELTIAPPNTKVTPSHKGNDAEEKPESTTQSTMSGTEEPSLRNVVTAAEDFIKVLATVSTSQSSATESEKGVSDGSEKKKRKNTGKKKKKTTKKRKGKGRKRKQKVEAVVRLEGGATVSPSGRKSEDAIALSNFISESHKQDLSNRDKVNDSEYELAGKDEPSNEVMRDEPAIDKETVSFTSPVTVQKKEFVTLTNAAEETTPSRHKTKKRQLRKGRTKTKTPPPSTEEVESHVAQPVMNPTDNIISVNTITSTPLTTQSELQRFTEKRPVISTASSPIVIPKVKRNRSKERRDREGRKKRRKVSSDSSIVATDHKNSSFDNLGVIPLTSAPTVTSVPKTEQQVSHRPDFSRVTMSVHNTTLNPSLSVLKRQRSKERGLRNKRRKTGALLSRENQPFLNSSEYVLQIPDLRDPSTTSRPTKEIGSESEWRPFTTALPTIVTKRHWSTIRQQRRQRNKTAAAVSIPKLTEHKTMTFTTTPAKAATTEDLNPQTSETTQPCTSTTRHMSPMQLTIAKVKEQLSRKKRRKAALSIRQQ